MVSLEVFELHFADLVEESVFYQIQLNKYLILFRFSIPDHCNLIFLGFDSELGKINTN